MSSVSRSDYRYVPDGSIELLPALSAVGKMMFADEWTGTEIGAPPADPRRQVQRETLRARGTITVTVPPARPRTPEVKRREDEARARFEAARNWLCNLLGSGRLPFQIVLDAGHILDGEAHVFRANNAMKVFEPRLRDVGRVECWGGPVGFGVIDGRVIVRETALVAAFTDEGVEDAPPDAHAAPGAPAETATSELSSDVRAKGAERRSADDMRDGDTAGAGRGRTDKEQELKKKLEAVLKEADLRMKNNKWLSSHRLAQLLVGEGKNGGYGESTLRKIIDGRYPSLRGLGILR